MDNFGIISTADSLPIPEGPHVRDFDAAQKAAKIAGRAKLGASRKPGKLANHGSRVSIVPAIAKIKGVSYQAPDFKSVEELKAAFEEADKEVKAKGRIAIDSHADVILALAKVQAILSQRGKEKMRREAGIRQGWTSYYQSFQKEFNFDLTLRAVQYKIAELAGKNRNRKCSECYRSSGHATSCSKYKEPPPPHLTQLEAKLLDAASRAHGVVMAVRQHGNVEEAIAEFEGTAPTPEKLSEYAERSVKPSLACPVEQPSKRPEPVFSLPLPEETPAPEPATPKTVVSALRTRARERAKRFGRRIEIVQREKTKTLDVIFHDLDGNDANLAITVAAYLMPRTLDIKNCVNELEKRINDGLPIRSEWYIELIAYTILCKELSAEEKIEFVARIEAWKSTDEEIEPQKSEPEPLTPDTPASVPPSLPEEKSGKLTPREVNGAFSIFLVGESSPIVENMPTLEAAWDEIDRLNNAGSLLLGSETSHER